MAEHRQALMTARDAAVNAENGCADVIDFLDVVGMALAYEDNATSPFSELSTVLGQARKIAVEAREAANLASNILAGEGGI